MLKIILPQNVLEKDKYGALSSSQKGEYVHTLLKQVLELNPKGITVSGIDKATYLGKSTIWHHLELLASRAECLKVEMGDTAIYHSNVVLASLKELGTKDKYFNYSFHLVENFLGRFARVQAKQDDKSGNNIVVSGMLINPDSLGDFLNSLGKIKENHLNGDSKQD